MNLVYLRTLSRLLFFCRLSQHVGAADAHTNAVNSKNLTALSTPSLGTSSALPWTINPSFSVVPAYHDTEIERHLNLSGILTDATNAMCAMALQPYMENMDESVWVYDLFPTVKIKIGGDAPMSRRFGIWGLEMCIGGMISSVRLRVERVVCKLYWDHGYVGRVEISENTVSPVSEEIMAVAAAALTGASTATSASPNASSAVTVHSLGLPPAPPSWRDPHLMLAHQRPGNAITVYDSFLSTLSTTRRLADLAPNAPLNADIINDPMAKIDVIYRTSGRTPDNPPYFEVQWLIKCLAVISKNFLLRGAYTEVYLNIYVDNIEVAILAVHRRWTRDGGLVGPTQNRTTA